MKDWRWFCFFIFPKANHSNQMDQFGQISPSLFSLAISLQESCKADKSLEEAENKLFANPMQRVTLQNVTSVAQTWCLTLHSWDTQEDASKQQASSHTVPFPLSKRCKVTVFITQMYLSSHLSFLPRRPFWSISIGQQEWISNYTELDQILLTLQSSSLQLFLQPVSPTGWWHVPDRVIPIKTGKSRIRKMEGTKTPALKERWHHKPPLLLAHQ